MRQLFGILIFMAAGLVQAAPVQYVFQGAGTGTLGGISFTDAAFEFKFSGDTAGIQWAPGYEYAVKINPIANGEFSIAGLGAGVLTETWAVYSSPFNDPLGSIGIARPPNGYNGFNGTFAGILGYGLDTTLGPIAALEAFIPYAPPGTSNIFLTTAGNLDFSSLSSLTFSATVVPIPGAIWLFISGLAILRWRRRAA